MVSINYAELYNNADQSVINNHPLPPDNYPAVVEAAEFKQASTGRSMYVVRFSIESGPHQGRKVTNNFVIVEENPTALGMFFKQMAALGIPSDWLTTTNPDPNQVVQRLIGARATIKVGIDSRNSDFNSVDGVRPPEGGTVAQPAAPQGVPQGAPQQGYQQPAQPQQFQQPTPQQFQQPVQQQPAPQQTPQQWQQPPAQQQQPVQQQQQPVQQQPPAQQFPAPQQQQQMPPQQQAPQQQQQAPQQQQQMPQPAQFEQQQPQQPQQQFQQPDQSQAGQPQLPAPPPF